LALILTKSFLPLFETAAEANIISWFSSLLLLIAGALLLLIARVETHSADTYARHWKILAWVFFFLSMDETASLHEELIVPLRNAIGTSGIFYFAWVIVAIPLLMLFGLFFLRFLLNLPRKTAIQLGVAGVIFVTGAVGFEMLGGIFHGASGIYRALVVVKETLENLGAGLFIVSLLIYAKFTLGSGPVVLEIRD